MRRLVLLFLGGLLLYGMFSVAWAAPTTESPEENEFIDYYTRIKDAVTAMHGIPRNDHAIWNNDLYEPLPDYWGVAVLIGHLTYSTSWDSPTGHISLSLSGNATASCCSTAAVRTSETGRKKLAARSCTPRFLLAGACT